MTVAAWILSLLLIAEFVMAPVNLWTGRTMPLFIRFTGYPPSVATRLFAPVKLASAALVAAGLVLPAAGVAGAAIITGVCAVYLIRLGAPGRRDTFGIAGFALFGSWAVALAARPTGPCWRWTRPGCATRSAITSCWDFRSRAMPQAKWPEGTLVLMGGTDGRRVGHGRRRHSL